MLLLLLLLLLPLLLVLVLVVVMILSRKPPPPSVIVSALIRRTSTKAFPEGHGDSLETANRSHSHSTNCQSAVKEGGGGGLNIPFDHT